MHDGRLVAQHDVHHVGVGAAAREVEGGATLLVRLLERCPGVDQDLHDGSVREEAREAQRRGAVALLRVDIGAQ
eukprot:5025141-Heterocapsa_arctica.AAC.1